MGKRDGEPRALRMDKQRQTKNCNSKSPNPPNDASTNPKTRKTIPPQNQPQQHKRRPTELREKRTGRMPKPAKQNRKTIPTNKRRRRNTAGIDEGRIGFSVPDRRAQVLVLNFAKYLSISGLNSIPTLSKQSNKSS